MKVRYRQQNLPFKHPFTISRGTKTHQPALLVELEHFGIRGYGEAPAISYYNIPVEKMIEDINLPPLKINIIYLEMWLMKFGITNVTLIHN